MIDRDHELTVTRQAELLATSRGSVYYLPRPVSEAGHIQAGIIGHTALVTQGSR